MEEYILLYADVPILNYKPLWVPIDYPIGKTIKF